MATRSSNGDDGTVELPDAVISDLLADETRHRALEILRERDDPVVVGDLAAEIVASERDVAVESVPEQDRRAVRDELLTDHLPKLTATGVVDYDSMVGTMALRRTEILSASEE